jgi:hypothetical protein
MDPATSPIAPYQPPREVTVGVADPGGGGALGSFLPPFAGTSITPADENSARFAFSEATRQ